MSVSEAEFSRLKQALTLRAQGLIYAEMGQRLHSTQRGTQGVTKERARQILLRALRTAWWVARDWSKRYGRANLDPDTCKQALLILEPYTHMPPLEK